MSKLGKENPGFQARMRSRESLDKERAILVDDTLPVLRSARSCGIGQLLAIRKPDSKQPGKDVGQFPAILDYREIRPR